MFSRLSRYLSRSKRRKNKYTPLPAVPAQLPPYPSIDPPSRPVTASSGHSSSCSIEPESAPSFLQVVCNDSQPVYCMETIPLYIPSALPPGTRKANSLYETAREEILKERMKVTALENDGERKRGRKRAASVRADEKRERRYERIRRWNSLRQEEHGQRGPKGYHPSIEERERDAEEYTSMDHYYGAPIYRDPPPTNQNYPHHMPSTPSVNYQDRDYRPPLPGPFRAPQQHQQQYPIERFPRPLSQHPDSIPAEPYFTRSSTIRQGPYHLFQNPPAPVSPYHHPGFYNEMSYRDTLYGHPFDDMSDIPTTRVTRLKPSYKTFGRDDGIRSDVGIGLGRISGMAPTRSVSGRRGGTKSDVGLGTRSQPLDVQVNPRPGNVN